MIGEEQAAATRVVMLKQADQVPKDAADYRWEGLALEEQGRYKEAFQEYFEPELVSVNKGKR